MFVLFSVHRDSLDTAMGEAMQVSKIQEAIDASKLFTKRAEEILQQSGSTTSFLLCDGKHAKILKKTAHKVIEAMQEMRRP